MAWFPKVALTSSRTNQGVVAVGPEDSRREPVGTRRGEGRVVPEPLGVSSCPRGLHHEEINGVR